MLEPLALNHVALPSRDPKALRRWYCDTFDLKAHGSYLWSGGTVLAITDGTPLPNDDWHFGFRLSTKASLLEWRERLLARGIAISNESGNDYYHSFYIRDPEGNDVELFFEEQPAE